MKIRHTPKLLLATACVLSASSAFAQSVSYDFNASQADYDANFTNAGGTNYSTLWEATGGVSNSGSMNTPGNQTTGYYTASNAGQFTTSGQTKFVSVYFLAGTNTTNLWDNRITVGFGTNTALSLVTGGGSFASATIQTIAVTDGNATSLALRYDYRNGGSLTSNTDVAFGTINNNEWYQLRMDLTYDGSNNYTGTTSLYSWGADGLTGGGLIDSFTRQLNSSSGGNLSTMTGVDLYAGFLGANTNGGIRALQIDNFAATTAIPEPSTFAALAGLGVLGLAASRRRRI